MMRCWQNTDGCKAEDAANGQSPLASPTTPLTPYFAAAQIASVALLAIYEMSSKYMKDSSGVVF